MATYTVVKGDCLWTIAQNKLGAGYRWVEIADLNNISRKNPIIYSGQVLTLPGSSTTPAPKANTSSAPTIQYLGLQAGTDNTIFVLWDWNKANTESFNTVWDYSTGDKDSKGNLIWFVGNDSTVSATNQQSTYSPPSNAKSIRFKVKAISKKYKTANGNETSYWVGTFSTARYYDLSNNPPTTPSTPNVTIEEDLKLTASLENLSELNATYIEFEVYRDDVLYKTSKSTIITGTSRVSYTCYVTAGSKYRIRCRAVRNGCPVPSDWTSFAGPYDTIPSIPKSITICRAESETSIYLEWSASTTATKYDIEYANKLEYFDGSNQTTTVSDIEFTHYLLSGLETGKEYFVRVRATNDTGGSGWSGIKSVVVGKDPAAPTTWSSTTTAITGEPLTLYWVHNAEDGSSMTYAELELTIDGVVQVPNITLENEYTAEEDKNKTHSYKITTDSYSEGTEIQWRVRTAGVTLSYGDWSIQRTIDVYAPPTLALTVTNSSGAAFSELESFPISISALAGPNTQAPIGYHLVVVANSSYETSDDTGNVKMVSVGEEVYSKYFDITSALETELSANDVNLENNIEYTLTCTVSMNSGLTTEDSCTFTVAWTDVGYEPTAEIGIDSDTISSYIRPYCEDENGALIDGVTLSVYRREFDGKFTEIAKDLPNSKTVFITDPHPALDYARYRIVSKTVATGAVRYYDVPGYPVEEKSVVIQWNENWSSFDAKSGDELSEQPWTGSMLKLPYNIDVSDDYGPDVSLIKYIGRSYPVSYYGTQIGSSSTWNVEVPKSDKETLYALRRLAIWMGDVYVREPSGSGYWANITVSFSQKHCEVVIPVSLNIVRIEGGI